MANKETSNGIMAVVVAAIIALVIIMSMLRSKEQTNVFIPKTNREQEVQSN